MKIIRNLNRTISEKSSAKRKEQKLILTGPEIIVRHRAREIIIEPFNESLVGPNSIDVRLGNKLFVVNTNSSRPAIGQNHGCNCIDMRLDPNKEELPLNIFGEWIVFPGRLYLGYTIEVVGSHNHAPEMHGRSTPARSGLSPIVSAGWGDTGFIGQWVMEITTAEHPMILVPGMRIAQIAFHEVTGVIQPYQRKGHYADQRGVVAGKGGNI